MTYTHTLSIDKVGTRWDVWYQGPEGEPALMFEQLTGPSSAVQLTAEALRRLEADAPDNELHIVDPTGLWTLWIKGKMNIPTHTIF